MNKKIAIIGAGGHGKVVGEIASLNQYKIIDFFDDKENEIKEFPFTISGSFDYLKEHLKDYDAFFVAIGDNEMRFNKIEWLKKQKINIVSLVHPRSTISKFSSLGIGSCVMANAVVNPGTLIKEGAIINSSASVDHDCIIEHFAHISPNCSLSGSVRIGKFSHLGTGTSVHPGIHIGNNVKTAVGSKIFKNILDDTVYKD
ncbi:acetyltransferase [Candidatus Pelagibacter bacterium]|nr:acetyltransferase [Candidatus Pelagibacter bacterium]|tara:strand:+ start:658 stop:1257 length:600 start_codon:yes stop_codon:yes gene_type:complete